MSIKVVFECGGCDATSEGTGRIHRTFTTFAGRPSGGFGTTRDTRIEEVTPDGWVAFDPYTYCCYCAECWADIQAHAKALEKKEAQG